MKLPKFPEGRGVKAKYIQGLPSDRLKLKKTLEPQTEEIINPEDRFRTPLLITIDRACSPPDKNNLAVFEDICTKVSGVFKENGFEINKIDIERQINKSACRHRGFRNAISDTDRLIQELCIGLQLAGLLE